MSMPPATGLPPRPQAAVIVVGTELVAGVRVDTNGAEVARALARAGFLPAVREIVPDDTGLLADRIANLAERYDLVAVTGGLGPTHDDITRDAAAHALGLSLAPDEGILQRLREVAARHRTAGAAAQVMRQADILSGAQVLLPDTGTAPGQLVETPRGHLLLLPGPPHELRPMLREALACLSIGEPLEQRVLGCVGMSESDAQVIAASVLGEHPGVGLTVLSRPALVDVILFDDGAGTAVVNEAATEVIAALGDVCYSDDGSTLAEVVVAAAIRCQATFALAESCTGGMVTSELTGVPGASAVLLGGAVTYSDAIKHTLLGVSEQSLRTHGAVSESVAREMAAGMRALAGADIALAITGIAGPGGGSADKPVGTVWFAVDAEGSALAIEHRFPGDRQAVRARATAVGLDLLRRVLNDPAAPAT